MKKSWIVILALGLSLGVFLPACAEKKAMTFNDIVEASKKLGVLTQKINYLMGQANTAYKARDYKMAMDLAQYVLGYLDRHNKQARAIFDKAKAQVESAAQGVATETKSKLPWLGK